MTNQEKIYTLLCTLFCMFIVVGNLVYQKFITLTLTPTLSFQLSAGALLYPLTFLITDLIVEFYGKEKAKFCLRLAIFINLMVALIINLMDHLEATPWSKVDDELFHVMFGFYGIAFASSLCASYIAQSVDVFLYQAIRNMTKGKYLWLRNNSSTAVSLLIDTTLVIGLMTTFGALPKEQMWLLIVNSYSWKLFFTLCATPFFYLCVFAIKFVQTPYSLTNKPSS